MWPKLAVVSNNVAINQLKESGQTTSVVYVDLAKTKVRMHGHL